MKKLTRKQGLAIAGILIIGLLLSGIVLLGERRGGEAAHVEADYSGENREGSHGESDHGKADHDEGGHDEGGHEEGGHKEARQKEHSKDDPQGEGKRAGPQEHEHKNEGEGGHADEDKVSLSEAQLRDAGVVLQVAGPAKLRASSQFQGEIRFDEDRTAHVVPRLAGVAEAVPARLGQTVKQGDVLAVIASPALSELRSELLAAQRRREAARVSFERERKLWQEKISAEQDYLQAQTQLQEAEIALANAAQKLSAVGAGPGTKGLNRFELRAPFAGTVVEKHLSLGEAVKEDASIFTLSDLSSVWAEFNVAPKDLATVRVGQQVEVSSTAFEGRTTGTVAYVGALLGEQTRTARARVVLANPGGAWRPGLFVTVSVLGAEEDVPLAVSADAVQTVEDRAVLFKAEEGGLVATPVKLGRSDGRKVVVLEGLAAGDRVATGNTFVLKSELGKAGAEHSH